MDENPYRAPLEMGPVQVSPGSGKLLTMTLTEGLVAAAIVGVLFALIEPAVQATLAATRRCECLPSLNQQQMREWRRAQQMRQKPKRDLGSLARSWGIPQAAIALILRACIWIITLAVIVFMAALWELWCEPTPAPRAAKPKRLSERAGT